MVELEIAPFRKDRDAIDIRRDFRRDCHASLLNRIRSSNFLSLSRAVWLLPLEPLRHPFSESINARLPFESLSVLSFCASYPDVHAASHHGRKKKSIGRRYRSIPSYAERAGSRFAEPE